MSRTPTHPPNDKGMWRKLGARAHPDSGGSADLVVWANHVRTVVCGGELGAEIPRREHQDHPSRWREASTSDTHRMPFDQFAIFEVLTDRAVTMADAVAEPFGYLLRQVADCYPTAEGPLHEHGA
jgi:hypothetical protein